MPVSPTGHSDGPKATRHFQMPIGGQQYLPWVKATGLPGPSFHPQVGVFGLWTHIQTLCLLLMQTLSQLETWSEAPGAPCGAAMGRSCPCTGGTATETCRPAATTTLARASTCSSSTTPTPSCATRLSTSTSTTPAEGPLGQGAGGVCCLEQAASWGLLFWIGKS